MADSSARKADYVLLAYIGLLLVFGLLMLMSASAPVGQASFGDRYFFIKRQLLYGALPGVFLFIIAARLKYQTLKQLPLLAYAGAVLLLIALFIPGIGATLGTNARSWIVLGGFSFQPAEIAKLGVILFLAWYLGSIGNRVEDPARGFLPALFLGSLPVLLILAQPDVGSAIILFSIIFGMLFFAGAKMTHLGALALIGLLGIAILAIIAPYRVDRFKTFLHPELDPKGVGYQINQAALAIGSGGWWGLGYGNSRQKLQYLPEVQSDSIFAIIAEEMGFVVSAGFLLLLLLIAYRSFFVAKHAPDQFGRLAVCGIVTWFLVQSCLNIGAMLGLLPLTGVPLPFVSQGGTALMIALGAAGILVNVSKYAK